MTNEPRETHEIEIESVNDPAAQSCDACDANDVDDELTKLQNNLLDAETRALRCQAELENFRKRIHRQMEDERKYASMPLLRDLLPVVDNLQRALAAAESAKNTSGLLEGVQLVSQQLNTVLEKHHCTAIDAKGKLFDPHLHEAIALYPSEDQPQGTILEVTQVGYQLHDRVARHSQVLVSSGPPQGRADKAGGGDSE